jgi:hypothetical protein
MRTRRVVQTLTSDNTCVFEKASLDGASIAIGLGVTAKGFAAETQTCMPKALPRRYSCPMRP